MNMNAIVDSIYKVDGTMDKRKTLEIKRAMKGALSMSRSATGEMIHRSNQFENKGLERQIRRLDRASVQCKNGYNSKKRTVLRKWCLVFEKQKSMNESIRELDAVLTKAIEEKELCLSGKQITRKAEVVPEEPEEEEEVVQEEVPEKIEPKRSGMDPSEIRAMMLKQQRGGTMNMNIKTNTKGVTSMILPKIDFGNTNMQLEVEVEPEDTAEEEDTWPLTDTEWISRYIRTEREKHGDLFTKNVLKNIKTSLTKSNPLHKFRLRAKISDDPLELLRNLSSAKVPMTANRIRDNLPPKALTTHPPTSARNIDTARSRKSKASDVTAKLPPLIRSKTML